MFLEISSRKLGRSFEFWASHRGGHIYLTSESRPGTLGQQICEGGGHRGNTLACSDNEVNFRRVCRRWYRQMLRAEQKWMG